MRRVIRSHLVKSLDVWFKTNEKILNACLSAVAGLFLLLQFSAITPYLHQRADTQAIVQATDNDAGWAIGVALKTHWLNDNHFRPYGPTYFRLSTFFHYLLGSPWNHEPNSSELLTSEETREVARHFLLQWISLLSALLLSFLLSYFKTGFTDFGPPAFGLQHFV